jgi:hypothetical protein
VGTGEFIERFLPQAGGCRTASLRGSSAWVGKERVMDRVSAERRTVRQPFVEHDGGPQWRSPLF